LEFRAVSDRETAQLRLTGVESQTLMMQGFTATIRHFCRLRRFPARTKVVAVNPAQQRT
jgi:hypothetical protein